MGQKKYTKNTQFSCNIFYSTENRKDKGKYTKSKQTRLILLLRCILPYTKVQKLLTLQIFHDTSVKTPQGQRRSFE